MGSHQHDIFIVTSWLRSERARGDDHANLEDAHAKAKQSFGELTSSIVDGTLNNYGTFVIGPCGSKVGWADDEEHKGKLHAYMKWIESQKYSDGSSAFDWAWFSYGEYGTNVLFSNCVDVMG